MPDLAAFQSDFAAALLVPTHADAPPGFGVYRNTVHKALLEAMAANYPVVRALIGDECFEGVARNYLHVHPPSEAVLAVLGRDFAGFLARSDLATELPYLADVARIERLRAEAHVAADADLAETPWTSSHIQLHPALRFAWFETPAFSIWQAHDEDRLERLEELVWKPEGVLVTRPFGAVRCGALTAGEHALLRGFDATRPILTAPSVFTDPPFRAGLDRLARAGAFADADGPIKKDDR